ncbi:hypothetical protein [Singulisphaera sp. PoT]|uniref:hypothetical protein n=1 Tax=Singulisphaera sp. PoT TaxID=3411797 RepID=UPI003BF5EF83
MSPTSTSPETHQPAFWPRQIAEEPTPNQLTFDIVVGMGLPLLCLGLDPIVFRSTLDLSPILGRYCIVGYLATSLGIISLAAWLRFKRPAGLLAGLLGGGAIFAFLLGVTLLPYSVAGLLLGVGVFGLSPFLTAFVFLRNALRALTRANLRSGSIAANLLVALGLMASCAGPWAAQGFVVTQLSHAERLLVSHDDRHVQQGIATVERWWFVADYDRLVLAYELENDAKRKEALARAYEHLSGNNIELRLARLHD